jgi:hypothetical protein
MSVHDHTVILGAKIFIDKYDFSSDFNAHSIGQTVELPEDTNYGDTFKQRLIGLRDMSFSIAGNVDASDGLTDEDTIITSKMGINNVPLIICPKGVAVGDPCEFGLIAKAQYTQDIKQGDVWKFGIAGNIASRRWIRGSVLWSSSTVISGTGNGAQVLLPPTSATTGNLYVAICVFAATTLTSMTVKVQSDTVGFPSATDQKQFTPVTAVTSEMPAPVTGLGTDTYYRAIVSAFSGTSAQMIVVAGQV